jgi:hypothetical protein
LCPDGPLHRLHPLEGVGDDQNFVFVHQSDAYPMHMVVYGA